MRSSHVLDVLLVDDEEKILRVFTRALATSYRMISAASVAEAEPIISAGVDVLICDVRLKDGSGIDLIRKARLAKKIPRTIAISGKASTKEAFEVGSAGALLYLEKPFSVDVLKQAIVDIGNVTPPLEAFVAARLGKQSMAEIEDAVRQTLLAQAMVHADGSFGHAARLLGITRQRVHQIVKPKMKKRAKAKQASDSVDER
jgi:DNA-binding NtrC family response regulator